MAGTVPERLNMGSEFARWSAKLGKLSDPSTFRRALAKAGEAGKKSALEAAAHDLGGDRKMRNLRGGALNVRVDEQGLTKVVLNFTGPWNLAESGRKKSGQIWRRGAHVTKGGRSTTRRGSAKRFNGAVRTPDGPRARSSYGPSRGLKTASEAKRKARTSVPKAYHGQFVNELGRIF
jgi:hypothetical protein